MIKEKEVLQEIAEAIDEMDKDDLACTYNYVTCHAITGDDIEESEGWHLIPLEGSH